MVSRRTTSTVPASVAIVAKCVRFPFAVRATFTFDIHFLVSGVAPTIGLLFFGFEQLFVPVFAGSAASGFLHDVVDFLALANRKTWI